MICLKCDSENFVEVEAECRQEFRGETLMVLTPMMACENCGWRTIGNEQIDELRVRTADAYRSKHNLLRSDQIKAMRKALQMNQLEFARLLCVGEASVKRWETWHVQDASSNHLMQLTAEIEKLRRRLAGYTTPKMSPGQMASEDIRIYSEFAYGKKHASSPDWESLYQNGLIQIIVKNISATFKPPSSTGDTSQIRRYVSNQAQQKHAKISIEDPSWAISRPPISGLSPPDISLKSSAFLFRRLLRQTMRESSKKKYRIETR